MPSVIPLKPHSRSFLEASESDDVFASTAAFWSI
jgi:hypothetical protein